MNSLSLISCLCHVIDPQKTPILAWMKNNQLLVKIANQTFIGRTRTDKKGQTYWKCKDFRKDQSSSPSEKELNSSDKSQLGQEKLP